MTLKNGVTVQSEIDANTYQLMRECERLKKEKESLANAVNVLEEINSDLYKKLNGVTVQDNTEISEELLQKLRNAPITILQEEPTIEVVQKWISVKDRLPEKYGKILALTPKTNGGYMSWLIWYHPKGGFYDNDPEWGDIPMDDVTHWMPLPEPPKGE